MIQSSMIQYWTACTQITLRLCIIVVKVFAGLVEFAKLLVRLITH